MRIDIITVLPELIEGFMKESIVGRAQRKGLVEIHILWTSGVVWMTILLAVSPVW